MTAVLPTGKREFSVHGNAHLHGTMKQWFSIAIFNLCIVAVIGVLLRYAFVNEIPSFEYRNWLHAHSHLAMLGWVYLALFVLIAHVFIPPGNEKKYYWLFWSTQFVVLGMLVSFIAKGYSALSIAFLIAHVLLSYIFVRSVWIDVSDAGQKGISVRLLRMSLVFQVISTIALWSIPVLNAFALRGTEYYYMAIQFFLHFQFNGWFVFGILALFFRFLEEKQIDIPKRASNVFLILLVVSCFLTYALAVAWSNPLPIVFIINGTGVSIQFLALMVFGYLLYVMKTNIHSTFSGTERMFIYVSLGCFLLKILIQTAVVIPELAQVGYTIRNFVIGFMHLILLGVITMGLFGFAFRNGLLSVKSRTSAILVLIGFVLVELLLFAQGILLWGALGFMPYYYECLTITSLVIAIGTIWMLLKQWEMNDR